MKVLRSLDRLGHDKNSVVTVGMFDGIHRAHREIVREVVHRARMREGRSVVVTFDPHPKEVVASARGPVQLLSTLDDRIEMLQDLHVDVVLIFKFTPAFSQLTAREFYEDVVAGEIGVSEVVVGYDHMFGRGREAGIQDLVEMGRTLDFSVFAVHPLSVDGAPISSTRIRHALAAGDVEKANAMLGYPFQLGGTIVGGDRRGRTIGFPTAHGAAPLKSLMAPTNEPPPVWPHPNGVVRGPSLLPLYEGLPLAAMDDPVFYELLALFDALRAGQARERELAKKFLEDRLR